ncbi:MAG: aminocarboxymuconate-semialdehyde decarboxylase [Mycobacterium sp.]|nr:aminocarboxymuconate-semialdehyde decarboxylase [Mycobacterium sp.]
MITAAIAPGVIDVHAHWLARELFALPPGGPYDGMDERAGQLYLGDIPLSIGTTVVADRPHIAHRGESCPDSRSGTGEVAAMEISIVTPPGQSGALPTRDSTDAMARVSRGWCLVQDRRNLVVVTMLFMTHNKAAATARRR